jgi:hypothetical protein
VLGRDFLVDLDGGVQRPGERRVLDDRDVVGARDLAAVTTDFVSPSA